MGMPQFPERKNRPQVCEIVLELLESVAVEELALAHILNAEGEKLQELVKKYAYSDICSTQFDKMCKSTYALINSLVIKEWVLLNKVNSALEIYDIMECEPHKCHCKHCENHKEKSKCDTRSSLEHKS